MKALNSLERYAVSPEEYRAWQEQRAARVPADTLPVIAAVRIDNRSRVADEVIAQRLEAAAGPLDVARLEHGVDRVFGLELFESTYYDIRRGPEGRYAHRHGDSRVAGASTTCRPGSVCSTTTPIPTSIWRCSTRAPR